MVERLFDLLSDAAWVAIPMRCWVATNNFLSQILGSGAQVLQQVPRGNTLAFAECMRQIVDERLSGFNLSDEVLDHDLSGSLSVFEGVNGHDVSPEKSCVTVDSVVASERVPRVRDARFCSIRSRAP
ncbi:MAG TPA: hypothetical protein VM910_16745 [Bradyrhizobium sp.]|jgi:hypothetical protein|nr:hypothetical protein [Bradyrhizobium sp.]